MNSGAQVGGRRRAALAFIFVTIVLDMLALGMIIPVLPHLIEDFILQGGGYGGPLTATGTATLKPPLLTPA